MVRNQSIAPSNSRQRSPGGLSAVSVRNFFSSSSRALTAAGSFECTATVASPMPCNAVASARSLS